MWRYCDAWCDREIKVFVDQHVGDTITVYGSMADLIDETVQDNGIAGHHIWFFRRRSPGASYTALTFPAAAERSVPGHEDPAGTYIAIAAGTKLIK